MALQPLGYSHLIDQYRLPARPLAVCARLDSGMRGRGERRQGDQEVLVFEPKYQPKNTLAGHLQFALRYEGINLEVLALLFERTGKVELEQWLTDKPSSIYARRACYLYEWLTGDRLAEEVVIRIPARVRYTRVLNPALQFEAPAGERDSRFRIINNLTGNPEFCPLVRRTPYLRERIERDDVRTRIHETLARYDADLLRRAAGYLYLKETQSSFEVEREKPSPDRAQRFADLLRRADTGTSLTEERLAELQQAVVDPRFHEFTWRREQNWVGVDLGYRKKIDFVPPRPEDVPALMSGLLALAERARSWYGHDEIDDEKTDERAMNADPVIIAAIVAFGFVFVHPFMDGNGRIHRYLIHDVLANAGFTPHGIVLPVSAVILAHLDEYVQVLESFSRPLRDRTDYDPDAPHIPARGNDAMYFRYFDATEQAEYLYRALERTIAEDLQREIDFLLGFDRASRRLNGLLDWPEHSLDLFIRVVHQNGGTLSKTKRGRQFDWMTDAEVRQAEEVVREVFETPPAETE